MASPKDFMAIWCYSSCLLHVVPARQNGFITRKDLEKRLARKRFGSFFGGKRMQTKTILFAKSWCPAKSVVELRILTSCHSPGTSKHLWFSPSVLVLPAPGPQKSCWIIATVTYSFQLKKQKAFSSWYKFWLLSVSYHCDRPGFVFWF